MASLLRGFANVTCRRSPSPLSGRVVKRFNSGESQGPLNVNPPGLSRNVVSVPNTPVGPGAAKNAAYKNPEYFCYSNTSFFEAEVEMGKYRMPQPSNKTPLTKP